ncbi:GTP cyclohydrolase I [uncultured Selenomonas sp.]|uniref:GTP cyclohydrolase I n=1 Tax=uncultured Selenomonas sp. TaxID=159275 RepID=UPI00258424D7|nr:GTP cyclohydrolase I [uncultured Selenomonas sp.]
MKKQTRGGAPDLRRAAAAMREFLAALGVSAASCGMEETPARTAELYAELFAGLRNDPAALWEETMTEDTAGLVAVRDIPFYSMCEHHLLPFFGTVDIVYRPQDGRVAGFGIFAQLAALYAARPQLQERLTAQIADEIVRGLGAAGVLVVVRAQQLCMMMRGERAHGTQTLTAECRGAFRSDAAETAAAWKMLGVHE